MKYFETFINGLYQNYIDKNLSDIVIFSEDDFIEVGDITIIGNKIYQVTNDYIAYLLDGKCISDGDNISDLLWKRMGFDNEAEYLKKLNVLYCKHESRILSLLELKEIYKNQL